MQEQNFQKTLYQDWYLEAHNLLGVFHNTFFHKIITCMKQVQFHLMQEQKLKLKKNLIKAHIIQLF